MQKFLFSIVIFLLSLEVRAQETALLDSAWAELLKPIRNQSLDKYFAALKNFVEQNETHTEGQYLLAYYYSRKNSKDGSQIPEMRTFLVKKSSEHLQSAIEQKNFSDLNLIILDPYSKITAEWGSLALKFWQKTQTDSVIWALKEGKKRGGFSDYWLATAESMLNNCEESAMLLTVGDMYLYPMMYQQWINKLRTDVSLISIDLLQTLWYGDFLEQEDKADFGKIKEIVAEQEYMQWESRAVKVGKAEWTIDPSFNGSKIILRRDLLTYGLMKENNWKRPVYFSVGYPPSYTIGMYKFMERIGKIERVVIDSQFSFSDERRHQNLTTHLSYYDLHNNKAMDEKDELSRSFTLAQNQILNFLKNEQKDEATRLIEFIKNSDYFKNDELKEGDRESWKRLNAWLESLSD